MNLFKKTTASIALVALVSGVFSTGAYANASSEIEAANALADNGIINTQADVNDYNLNDNVLRQEIAKIAVNMADDIAVKTTCDNSFSDVSATTPNTWACGYAEALLDAGKVSANSNFRPEDNISKSEAVKMVLEAAGYTDIYTDDAKWQEQVVDFAVSEGVVSSFSNYDTSATRGFIFEAASKSIDATSDETAEACDDISQLLGLCGEEETTEETTSEETTSEETPVVIDGDNVLTIELSPETPMDGYVVVQVARTPVLSFDVTAGSEDVSLDKVNLLFSGFGARTDVDDVTIYNSDNVSVSKTRNFVDKDLEISFDNGIVVKAGNTETFTVTANINTAASTTTYQITLETLEASSTVEGSNLVGASLTPINFANSAELRVVDDKASKDVIVGEVVKLAGFDLEERTDNEDVLVKTVTLHLSGSVDGDFIEELTLSVDGEVIASNLSVNSDDEVVANIDYILAADDKVTFELEGMVTGDVSETIEFVFKNDDDIYAVGASSGYNVGFESGYEATTADIAASKTVEGSEVNVSFTKSDLDETKTDRDDVLLGTLKVNALTDDYEINTITVVVTGDNAGALIAADINSTVKNLYLGGNVYDTAVLGTNEVTYTFEDIVLSANEEEELLLEMDVESATSLNGNELTFDITITQVEDVTNDVIYSGGTLSDVLSTTSFDDKKITIESATFELAQTSINDRTLVLGNVADVLVYKGKVTVGDSDSVILDDFELTVVGTIAVGVNLDDVVDSAELRIGSKVYDADLNTNSIAFSNIAHEVVAGTNQEELTVYVNLKDDDTLTGSANNFELEINAVGDLTLEDSVGDSLESGNITVTTGSVTATTLRENGTFTVNFNTDEDTTNLTGVDNFALAGSDDVVLAKVEFDADYENAIVNELSFTISGSTDFSNTLNNVRLISEGVVIAEGATVSHGSQTVITFDDIFEIAQEGQVEASIVADLNPITDEGGFTSSTAGAIQLTLTGAFDIEGAVSLDAVAYAAPSVTPNTLTVAANTVAGIVLESSTTLSSAGTDSAIATLVIDTANQDFNKENDGSDIIEAYLDTVALNFVGAAVVTDIKIERAGVTLTGTLTSTGNMSFDTSSLSAQDLIDFATIDSGNAEFDILVSYTSATTDDDLTIKLVSDTDVTLDDGNGTTITKVFSSKTSISTKTTEVTISR